MNNQKISPDYYNQRRYSGKQYLNCKELIDEMTFSCSGIEAFYVGNIVKYLWRYRDKGNPVQDLKKAYTYTDFLCEYVAKNGMYRPNGFIGCSASSVYLGEVKNLLCGERKNEGNQDEKYLTVVALSIINTCTLCDRHEIVKHLEFGLSALLKLIQLYEK